MQRVAVWVALAALATAVCGVFLPLAAVGAESVTIWNPQPRGFFDAIAAIEVSSPSLWQMSRIIGLLSLAFLLLAAVALWTGDRSGIAPLAVLALLGPAYLVARYGGELTVPSGPFTLGSWNLGFAFLVVGCIALMVLGVASHYAAPSSDKA